MVEVMWKSRIGNIVQCCTVPMQQCEKQKDIYTVLTRNLHSRGQLRYQFYTYI